MSETEQSRWEYHVELLREVRVVERAAAVRHLGEQGWELVSTTRQGLVFRRPRLGGNEDPLVPSTLANTILIAEAESSLRFLLAATFVLEGYRVLEATSGEHAWALLERFQPRVAILGERLPGLPELELVQEIKRAPLLRETRLVLIVSEKAQIDQPTALEAGVDLFLVKPIALGPLLAQIDTWSSAAD